MNEPRDGAFQVLMEAAGQFNERPSDVRREAVETAAFVLVDAHGYHIVPRRGSAEEGT